MNKSPLYIILLLTFILYNTIINAQTPNDTLRVFDYKTKANKVSDVLREAEEPILYEYCDEDGFIDVNISQIENDVLSQYGISENDDEVIFISTSIGKVLKINAPLESNSIEDICPLELPGFALSDIAVDENGDFFINSFSQILSLDTTTCVALTLFNFGFSSDVNSLSFDTNGNMYYGFGSSSSVYRYDANELTPTYVWHDFQTGTAGGDFVVLNGKMYIAWLDTTYRLFEVSYDDDFNYVSHIDLGEIPYQTYGLASELGQLYGVTPTELYKIDLVDFLFTTVLENDGTYGDWFGASGSTLKLNF